MPGLVILASAWEPMVEVDIYSGAAVEVFISWCWHLLHRHGTGATDGEGIRLPEAS